MRDIDELLEDDKKEQAAFDPDIPRSILNARHKRKIHLARHPHTTRCAPGRSFEFSEEQKEDIYYMIDVNGKHRPIIKELLLKVKEQGRNLDEFVEKWTDLK